LIVTVEDRVFSAVSSDPFDLMELLGSAWRGWHDLQIDPPWAPGEALEVNRWLEKQSPEVQERAELALASGPEMLNRREAGSSRLRITSAAEDWAADVPRLPLARAVALLRRPLRLMVEDQANDGMFLRTVTPEDRRPALERALDEGRIEIVHGGGLDRMKPQIERASLAEIMRLWVLFDSDAKQSPARDWASPDSKKICEICREKKIACHQLQRGAAENYLPLDALAHWTQLGERKGRKGELLTGSARKQREKIYLAFKRMSPEQRYYYPMKQGFSWFTKRQREIPELYSDISRDPELKDGFPKAAELFRQEHFKFHEEWLRKDHQQDETARMARSIFRCL
jgi:hypothetical protein